MALFGIFAENIYSMNRHLILLIFFLAFLGCQRQDSPEPWLLLVDHPAQIWEECFPLGNGHLGMMPDGGVEKETIVLNDITLWSGAPSDDSNPLALQSLPEIQRLLKEGKNDEAQNLMYETFVCGGEGSGHGQGAKVPFGCYQTLGNMTIEYHYPNVDSVTDYQRILCLDDATHMVSFDKGGRHYEREAFVSRTDDVAVIRLSGSFLCSFALSREEKAQVITDADGVVMFGQLDSNVEGVEGMKAGPGLMFVSLPKVFASMHALGRLAGLAFFVMAAFAALTSCVSVLETITANCMEIFHVRRRPATIFLTLLYTAASVIVALGYSLFYVELPLPNGSVGQILDLMDYISNSFLMPFISMLSAILIGWVIGPDWITEEIEHGGRRFGLKRLYALMIRWVIPVIMFILFLQSTGILNF